MPAKVSVRVRMVTAGLAKDGVEGGSGHGAEGQGQRHKPGAGGEGLLEELEARRRRG
jgi:hypothetical protein